MRSEIRNCALYLSMSAGALANFTITPPSRASDAGTVPAAATEGTDALPRVSPEVEKVFGIIEADRAHRDATWREIGKYREESIRQERRGEELQEKNSINARVLKSKEGELRKLEKANDARQARLDKISEQSRPLEQKVSEKEKRLAELNERIVRQRKRIDGLNGELKGHHETIEASEAKLAALHREIDEMKAFVESRTQRQPRPRHGHRID